MMATVFTIKIVERYAFGSRCSRSTTIACGTFCSTSCRSRTREIDVSDVSADAASAASTSATRITTSSSQAVVSKFLPLLEELADGPILVHTKDRLSKQWRDGEDFDFRMLLLRWQRHGVGDHDLFDR